jgi:hypothetical protein
MPSRFDMPEDPKQPGGGSAKVDITKRYDVYCVEHGLRTVVHRNVLFKGTRSLFGRDDRFDVLSQFIELEQPNGQVVFVGRHGIVRFCEHGAEPAVEVIPTR